VKKKTERLHRLVRKLGAKYGKKDADVVRLQEELDTLIKMEKAKHDEASSKVVIPQGPSPAKILYLEELRAQKL